MELRHLRYFVTVAEELHFTRAAERLHIGQPPLSQQIQALEAELGVQLFVRDKRNVKLTEAGEHFLLRARKILDDTRRATDETQRIARGEMGELRIAFTASLPLTPLLASVLNTFHQQYPQVTLTLAERFTRSQFDALRHNEIDIGFVRHHSETPLPGLQLEELFRDPLMVVIRECHPLYHAAGLKLADLHDETFISYPVNSGSGLNTVLKRLYQSAGYQPTVGQIAAESITQIGLVAAGLGIAILPSPLACVHIGDVRYVPLLDDGAYLTMTIATREGDDSAQVAHFRRCCLDSLGIC